MSLSMNYSVFFFRVGVDDNQLIIDLSYSSMNYLSSFLGDDITQAYALVTKRKKKYWNIIPVQNSAQYHSGRENNKGFIIFISDSKLVLYSRPFCGIKALLTGDFPPRFSRLVNFVSRYGGVLIQSVTFNSPGKIANCQH